MPTSEMAAADPHTDLCLSSRFRSSFYTHSFHLTVRPQRQNQSPQAPSLDKQWHKRYSQGHLSKTHQHQDIGIHCSEQAVSAPAVRVNLKWVLLMWDKSHNFHWH
jgi:hypothetical protein